MADITSWNLNEGMVAYVRLDCQHPGVCGQVDVCCSHYVIVKYYVTVYL